MITQPFGIHIDTSMNPQDDAILLKWTDRTCGCRTEWWIDYYHKFKVPVRCRLHGGQRKVELTRRDLPKLERRLNDLQRQITYISLLDEETQN